MTTFEVKRLQALYQLRLDIVEKALQEQWSSQRLCIAQAKRDMMEKVLTCWECSMMNKTFDEWGETEFNEWISKMYWEWYFCVWEPLEAAIEKRDKTEGENA